MIHEKGRIVAIEPEGIWVETIQRSTCDSCSAEKGCGQSLMAKLSGHTSYLWVLLQGRDAAQYQLGDEVEIGVPESVVVNGSLFAYLVPLLAMMFAAGMAHQQFAQEGITILSAFIGLVVGALVVRWRSHHIRFDSRLQPVLIDDHKPLRIQT